MKALFPRKGSGRLENERCCFLSDLAVVKEAEKWRGRLPWGRTDPLPLWGGLWELCPSTDPFNSHRD